jgi:hypothetical protein
MNLKPIVDKEDRLNTAIAPCGALVYVPVGSRNGSWVHCEACGNSHQLIKVNSDGKPAKLK